MMQADRYLTDKEKSAIELYFELNADSAAEYNALKVQYPDALVGFEQNGQFEFYGEDARKICELTGGKLLERETALGTVLVTGFPREQWVYRAKQLWECGENIYLVGLNEEGAPELAGNFRITDEELGAGGPKQKFARNIKAIKTLFTLEQEHRGATAEEQQVLSQYVGWGGLADAFDPDKSS